jgi:glycosyltransferase involved in cell wall biosynthesis
MGLRLAVIGDTQHYRDEQGRLCALEPVVNQLDRWAELFDELVLCAPLDPGPPPAGFAPYQAANLRIEPLRRGGGNTIAAKLSMLVDLGPWALTTRRVAKSVDAVHLRCPCNIGLVAIISTLGTGSYRYAMYAGVWQDYRGQPWSYRAQRWLLARRSFGGPVSVYADRDPRRPHLEPFFSPSFSLKDWDAAADAAAAKVERIRAGGGSGPLRLVSVGRLTPNKNQRTIVLALQRLRDAGVEATLDLYGDGASRGELEALVAQLGLGDRVTFHGSVGHPEVMEAFAGADLNLLSTRQEGYGKVLLEGMVHATVPIFGSSPVSGEISGHGERGLVFDPDDDAALARHVQELVADRERWASLAEASRAYARTVSLETFQGRIKEMLERQWGVQLPGTGGAGPT